MNSVNQQSDVPDNYPQLFVTSNGKEINDSQDWFNIKRPEIKELFQKEVYGINPDFSREISLDSQIISEKRVYSGKAICRQVEIKFSSHLNELCINILLYLPVQKKETVPVFLGLNFFGNHTIVDDSDIIISDSWARKNDAIGVTNHRLTEETRGSYKSRWPLEMILEKGYGLATLYNGEIAPDSEKEFKNGVWSLFKEKTEERDFRDWGNIGLWAWGLCRTVDYLETVSEIDKSRIIAIGHSRLGKAALWAGAQDERFALTISNDSGCGGASLSRRRYGETVKIINERFPHWFCKNFRKYGENEEELPVDQHMLLSLIAPRPLYVASAEKDSWADPEGEFLSAKYSSEVYQLLDNNDRLNEMPEVDEPCHQGKVGYHIRSGGHELTKYDWEQFLIFADRYLD
ncbi:MAG: acetylxylan esterase [bacterium]